MMPGENAGRNDSREKPSGTDKEKTGNYHDDKGYCK